VGAFHCPMGAPFYDSEGCILCGLCIATTNEEMVEASKKIRAYLRSQPERRSRFQKIAICGKGGTGKSTITTLMAIALREEGYNVLVVDTDESNPGLYRMFGFDKEPRPLIELLSRFSADKPAPDTKWLAQDKISVQSIPEEYLLESDGLKFMMVGKIVDPFQGCACSMADMTRDLVGKLLLKDKQVAIIDSEAGIESFGRGVERSVDTLLMIVEPSFESIALAEKMSYMADGIGVRMVKAILNKIPSEETRRKMIEALVKKNVSQIGAVPLDPEVSEAGFEGKALGESKAKEETRKIARLLLGEANGI